MPPKSRQKAKKASSWDSVQVGTTDTAPDAEPATPKEGRAPQQPHWPSRGIAAAALALLAYGAKVSLRIPAGSLDTWAGEPLRKRFTGMGPADVLLSQMVSAFSFPLSGKDPESRIQTMYLLSMLGASVLVWIIEGWRRDNRPSTFLAACQIFGVGLVAPLYFALSILSDKGDILSISTPPEIAKAVFPGVLVGFFLPTYFMFLEHSDVILHQKVTALWQASPVVAAVLTTFIAAFIRRAALGPDSAKFNQAKIAEKKTGDPLPALRFAYVMTAIILAAVHHYLIFDVIVASEMSLYDVFFNVPHPFAQWDLTNPYSAMGLFLKFDLIFYTVSVMFYLLYCIVDLKMLSCISTNQARRAAVAVLLGPLAVGPGATYVGFWWWREERLAEKA